MNGEVEKRSENGTFSSSSRINQDIETNSEVAPHKQTDVNVSRAMNSEDEGETLGYCKFVVSHYRLAFGIMLGAHILMFILTGVLLAAGYDVLPINFTELPLNLEDDPAKLRTDAWWFVENNSSLTTLDGKQNTRSIQYQTITIVYELKGGNIFTKENLLAIQNNENELLNKPNYKNKLCQLQFNPSTNQTCKLPLSILRFFDGTYQGIDAKLYDPHFDNIGMVLHTAQSTKLGKAILTFHLGKNAVIENNTAISQYTRSMIYTGWPTEGFSSTNDREEDQAEKIDKLIVDTFADDLANKYEEGLNNMNVYYDNQALSRNAIQKQVPMDMLLAVASFVFIFIFVWFQTGSLWVTAWGIFSIISSFNITNLIYRIVLDYRYFGIFHVLSIFIILGIGSDDIFVFMDTWKQSRVESFKNLSERLSWAYKRASKTTLVTSLTTMVAFVSNMRSPLLAISSFGLFSAILIIVNYISIILFLPTVMIFNHTNGGDMMGDRPNRRCCCGRTRGRSETEPEVSESNSRDRKKDKHLNQYIIKFFEGWFFRNIIAHKKVRWFVIVVFVVLTAVTTRFATLLEPDKEPVKIFKPDTNWQQVRDLRESAFRPSQEDRVLVVHIIWGLKEQDRSQCHHTDFKCKGKTVLDKGFDLNPPPCQNAMLELCSKMKNLPQAQEKKLNLRRSQATGEVEIKCIFERMNEYLKDESNNTKYPSGSDFSFPIDREKMTTMFRFNSQISNVTFPETYYRFFEVGAGYFMTQGGRKDFSSSYDYKKYKDLIGGELNTITIKNETMTQGNKYGQRLLFVAIAANTTLGIAGDGFEKGLRVHDEWERFVNNEMSSFPPSCSNGFQATVTHWNTWHWLKVQKILVDNAISGIVIGLVLTVIVLTLTTTNVIVGVMATITITMVTAGVLGVISIVGWKLGLFESLNLTLIVGLAVDYVVHLAEGYMELEDEDRLTRVRYTLGHVGISVFSGACTTLGASIFMLAAKIIFFSQFGIFIFCTIGFSILYSLFFFTTALALIGPEGETGSLKPIARKIKNYMRGKTERHVDCSFCKGKGFHGKDLTVVIENPTLDTHL